MSILGQTINLITEKISEMLTKAIYAIYRKCLYLLLAIMFVGASCFQAVGDETPSKFLMFDSRIIEQTDNAVLRVEPAVKCGRNPLERWTQHVPWKMKSDYKLKHLIAGVEVPVWEKQTAILYPNVIWDKEDQLFKMWYYSRMREDRSSRKNAPWVSHIQPRDQIVDGYLAECYMVSEDGLSWSRPAMDAFTYKGKPTNIVELGNAGAGVFKCPHDPDPNRRYKMIARREPATKKGTSIKVSESPDGIHWNNFRHAFTAKGDTHNNAFWAPDIQKYVAISRQYNYREKLRTVVRSESKDFVNWSDVEEIMRGPNDAQIYTLLPIYYAPGYYIGLMSIIKANGQVHTELAWSPDTRDWRRIDEGTPFIANSEATDGCDHGMIYASAPVVLDKEIRIYYAGVAEKHLVPEWRTTSLNLATVGRDRFAGYECKDPQRVGVVTTKPFQLTGDVLKITADVQEGGEIRVAAIDALGNPIPGFAFADCDAVTESVTDRAIKWGDKDLSHLGHGKMALRFQLNRAKIFSIGGHMIPMH